jgi:hypothetical protein
MKSMSMDAQGSAALSWVCRCSSGLRSASSPVIHSLGGRERVHPRDHADALRVGVGLQHRPPDRRRLGEHRQADDLGGQAARGREHALDLRGLLGDLFEGLRPVQVLAAGEKPDLLLGHVRSCP